MIALGIDVGYGHTKALSSIGGSVTFPSVVGVAEAEGFRLAVGTTDRRALQGGTLALNGASYLYGEQALRHARTVVQPRDRNWLQSRPLSGFVGSRDRIARSAWVSSGDCDRFASQFLPRPAHLRTGGA